MMWGKGKPNRHLFLHSIILWDFLKIIILFPDSRRKSAWGGSSPHFSYLWCCLDNPWSKEEGRGGGDDGAVVWALHVHTTGRASFLLCHLTLPETPGAGGIAVPIVQMSQMRLPQDTGRTQVTTWVPKYPKIHTHTGVIPVPELSATLQDFSLIGCLALSHFSALLTVFIHSPPSSLPDSYWFSCMMVPLASNSFAISSPIFKWTLSSVA